MRVEMVSLPLPEVPLGSVNSYIINGSLIIDPGMYSAPSLHALLSAIKGAGSRACEIEKIVITHFHVDHMSALPVLAQVGEPEMYMGRRDLDLIKRGAHLFVERVLDIFALNGMSLDEIAMIKRSHPIMRLKSLYEEVIPSMEIAPLEEGSHVKVGDEKLRVIELPGHTPGSIGLVSGDVAFVGDVAIEGITPHVILHDMSEDPLAEHLESLRRLSSMNISVAYSGHREPIRELSRRAREIAAAHERRLAEILELLRAGERSAYRIARSVRWRVKYSSWDDFPPAERFFAMGETLSHLRHLERRGLARSYEEGKRTLWEPAY